MARAGSVKRWGLKDKRLSKKRGLIKRNNTNTNNHRYRNNGEAKGVRHSISMTELESETNCKKFNNQLAPEFETNRHVGTLEPLQLLLSTFTECCEEMSNETAHDENNVACVRVNEKEVHVSHQKEVSDVLPPSEQYDDLDEISCLNEVSQNEVKESEVSCKKNYDENNLKLSDVEETACTSSDAFERHFNYDLDASLIEVLTSSPVKFKNIDLYWSSLHNLKVEVPLVGENFREGVPECARLEEKQKNVKIGIDVPFPVEKLNWNKLCVRSIIQDNIKTANKNQLDERSTEDLTELQKEVFSIINNYQDFFYPERNLVNGEEIRFVYCLHAVNHVLKTRLKILHHNEKLLKKSSLEVPDEYRDQGLVRPKVLILVPFKDSCLRIVNIMSSILIREDKGNIINKIRFQEEFSGSELVIPKKNMKPEDYEKLFKGNIDDKFKIGISFTKKSMKLFSDFYASDIIIASPLGLRLVIGADGDKERDFDFLSSIELLILDQAELFIMQNWNHLLLILDHLHIQPRESHGTDFSRIRPWVLNGWSKFYRQTLIFSSVVLPELNAVYNRRCFNFSGKVRVSNPTCAGGISLVIVQLSHVFQKFKADSAMEAYEARFKFFVDRVLPQYKDPGMTGVLIYVPSYFDYVKIRNYLKREDYSFVQICEYSKDARIARARDKFYHRQVRYLLYSERFHFFRRIKLKGIKHIIFYQLPTFPHFYSELCNLMKPTENHFIGVDCIASLTAVYCKYDVHQLSAIVGTTKAVKMLSSEKEVHMFTTG